MSKLESRRAELLRAGIEDAAPLCDIRGCTEEILCYIDGKAHCPLHTEDMIERWEAVAEYGGMREYLEPLPYR